MLNHGIYHLSETIAQERDVLKFDVDLNTIHHYKSKGFKIDVDVIGPRIICKRPKSESDYSADYLRLHEGDFLLWWRIRLSGTHAYRGIFTLFAITRKI